MTVLYNILTLENDMINEHTSVQNFGKLQIHQQV